jgi:hypothetical protein
MYVLLKCRQVADSDIHATTRHARNRLFYRSKNGVQGRIGRKLLQRAIQGRQESKFTDVSRSDRKDTACTFWAKRRRSTGRPSHQIQRFNESRRYVHSHGRRLHAAPHEHEEFVAVCIAQSLESAANRRLRQT